MTIPTGTLFLVFLILKLTGVIAWSWWWVTAPLWAVPALVLALVTLWIVCVLIGMCAGADIQ